MKKLLSIALCAAAVSAFGDPTETQLGGEIGVTAITSSLQNTIVAVSYDDLDSSVTSGIAISNLVKTANLTVGDLLMIYVNGEYSTWTLQQDGVGEGKPKYWAKTDITLTVNADGSQTNGSGSEASDVICGVGTGIWLVRSRDYIPGTEYTFYIYGKPVSNPKSQTEGGKWTLVGNPTQEPKTIGVSAGQVEVAGAKEGDQIVAIDAGGVLRYYAFSPTYGWRRNNQGTAESLPAIGAGFGIWIRTAENATISW